MILSLLEEKDSLLFLFCLMFLIVLLNAMPFSNSLIGFVIGNIIYCSDKILIKKHLSCNVTTHI